MANKFDLINSGNDQHHPALLWRFCDSDAALNTSPDLLTCKKTQHETETKDTKMSNKNTQRSIWFSVRTENDINRGVPKGCKGIYSLQMAMHCTSSATSYQRGKYIISVTFIPPKWNPGMPVDIWSETVQEKI